MATRISVRKNPNGQSTGWTCKHSSNAGQPAECDGHVILCERCHASVGNGAELLNYETRQPIEPAKVTLAALAKRAAAGK